MRMLLSGVAALAAATGFAFPAHAGLTLVDDTIFGVDAAAIDSATGLIWLKPIHSTGISYVDMVQHIEENGSYHGYKLATSSQFVSMAKNYHTAFGNFFRTAYGNFTYDPGIVSGGRAFVGFFEPTFITSFYIGGEPKWPVYRLTGFLLQQSGGPYVDAVDIRYDAPGDPPYTGESIQNASLTYPYITVSGSSDGIGFWLVRSASDAIPEPAAWALMIAGFGLVGSAARRRRAAAVCG